ncbi:MAG: zinc-binding dehydrogenase [Acidimicrobiales bacterium]
MTPTSTRAAVLRSFGEPLVLEELPIPEEIQRGAAVVRVSCCTLCGTDAHLWAGRMAWPGMLPIVLGHEMIGVVESVGPDCVDALGRAVEVGQRIGWSESTCGHCYACSVLRDPVACRNRGYGFLQHSDQWPFVIGGLSERCYVTAGAAKLVLPDDIEDEMAAAAGCAIKTVVRAIDAAGGIRLGSTVVIQGAGALGIFATALASIAGARTVITIGAPDERLSLAREFGANATIGLESDAASRAAEVIDLSGGRGADVLFDFAGGPGVGGEAIQMAAQGATYVVVGTTGGTPEPLPLGTIMGKEMTVRGSLNGDNSDYARSIALIPQLRRFPLGNIFSPPVGLEGASAALESMAQLKQVKAVVRPGQS